MKTERRHELQTNKLSDVLGHQIEGLRPHTTKILVGGIVGAVVVIAIAMISKDRQSALTQARNDLFLALAAQDREALKSVAKTHTGTPVSWWAKSAQADLDLNNGLSALYINRDEAFQSLDDAKKAYTEVMNGVTGNPELVRHATFGLASAQEASSNLDKAKELYERIVQQYPDSPIATESRARLEAIKDPQIEKWYSWFARQKPKPRAPMSGNIPGMPSGLGSLPSSPDFGPLSAPAEPSPGTTSPGTTSPGTTSPGPTSPGPTSPGPTSPGPGSTDAKDTAAPAQPPAEAPPSTPPGSTTKDDAKSGAESKSESTDKKPSDAKAESSPPANSPAEAKASESESTSPAKPSSDSPSP